LYYHIGKKKIDIQAGNYLSLAGRLNAMNLKNGKMKGILSCGM